MERIYTTQRWDMADLPLQETLFHNANGYLGVRGALEEGLPQGADTMRGTYINGFYELVPMKQAEKLTNVLEEKESMINVGDPQGLRIAVDGQWFHQLEGEMLSYRRSLDMDAGITSREMVWRSPKGHQVAISFRRLASFVLPEMFTIDCRVTALNFAGTVEVESTQLALVRNYADPNDPRLAHSSQCHLVPAGHVFKGDASYLSVTTRRSGLKLTGGVRHWTDLAPSAARWDYDPQGHQVAFRYTFHLEQGQSLRLVKYCVFADSRRSDDTLAHAMTAMEKGYGRMDWLYEQQRLELDGFWKNAGTCIQGDGEANLSMQFNLYQLFQSAGKDGLCSIAAKGLSGEGYEGHYFWDTEMYMMPFFTLTMPQLARKLLGYRYLTLPQARENARLLGHKKGALYPWRTITGQECSGYFPAGTAQYHIVGDIAYAVANYYIATDDRDYMIREGAEILLETARLWMEVGHEYQGSFRIHCVTGPDEYTCIVNNNYYTNACAQHNLRWAVRAMELLKQWGAYQRWAARLQVEPGEAEAFAHAADIMFLPYDEALDINPQDDSFLEKPVWDFAATPPENHPLLLHYHPLQLYRYQVCKQADTVLAHVLFGQLERLETRRNSFAYYEKVTTHDSSLSNCIFCIDACRLGLRAKARSYFGDSIKTDLMNTHGNTKDGIHTANMGGCYLAVVSGFAGLELEEHAIRLNPFLPEDWTGLSFRFQYHGSHLAFDMEGDGYTLKLESGQGVTVHTPEGQYQLEEPGQQLAGTVAGAVGQAG